MNKKTVIIFSVIGTIILMLIGVILWINSPSKQEDYSAPVNRLSPTPNQTSNAQSNRITTFQKTYPGVSRASSVKQISTIISTSTGTDGSLIYNLSSNNHARDDQIITNQDVVLFEKSVTTDSQYHHPKLSDIVKQYGKPEKILTGSRDYDELVKTYVYASLGFAVIGNPTTDEIYEQRTFIPSSVIRYIELWGKDVKDYKTPKEGF